MNEVSRKHWAIYLKCRMKNCSQLDTDVKSSNKQQQQPSKSKISFVYRHERTTDIFAVGEKLQVKASDESIKQEQQMVLNRFMTGHSNKNILQLHIKNTHSAAMLCPYALQWCILNC